MQIIKLNNYTGYNVNIYLICGSPMSHRDGRINKKKNKKEMG